MIKSIKNNFLLKSTVIVTASSLVSNVFSYAFQLVMGRALSVEEYGILIALFSVFSIFVLPTTIVASSITKIVSGIKNVNYPEGISSLYYSLLKINIGISVVVMLLLILSKNFLLDYLNINFARVFVPFVFYVGISLIFSHNLSFLQSLQRFKAVSIISFLTAFAKFLASIIIYFLNLGLYATFLLVGFFMFLSGISGYGLLLKNINKKIKSFSTNNLGKIYKFALASSFALVGINLMQNTDVVLVKHFFSAEAAGFYASSAVIGRIIFYGVSPVAVVFFPVCAEKHHRGENYILPMFKALGVVSLLSILGASVFYFFPTLIISTLFGQKYISAVQYLPYYSIYIMVYSIFAIFTWLLISISKLKLASITLVLAVFQYLTVKWFYHESVNQILLVFTVYIMLGLAVYLIAMYKDINKFVINRNAD